MKLMRVITWCFFMTSVFATIACNNTVKSANEAASKERVEKAISCTKNGLTIADSTIYANGGGNYYKETVENKIERPVAIPEGMVWIPGGEFSMGGVNPVGITEGGHEHMEDARPVHRVYVDGFYMDETEVTNAEFAKFVNATGYVTIAEKKPTTEDLPGVPSENLVAGSIVFTPPAQRVSLNDYLQWWSYIPGADWKHPLGEESNIQGKENYPVVQVAWEDALAYCKWAGKRLPTEAEWEFAARGGKAGNLYAWGNQLKPEGKFMANTFEGSFPNNDDGSDGFKGIAPVHQFAPNAYGLFDIAGNVWEWCYDWYQADYYKEVAKRQVVKNPTGPLDSYDPVEPTAKKKVQRGGSFLCTDEYCTRYMVGTRGKGEYRSPTNHVGFRCVISMSRVSHQALRTPKL